MLQIQHLSKRFGKKEVVRDLSLEVNKGEILVLLGKSGSGKTTTLKMINRLIEPSAGRILIDQQDVLAMQPELLRRRIGYVIQDNGLFPHYTVAENVALVPRLLDWDKAKQDAQSRKMLQMLDMDPDAYLRKYPAELSGGQQQRVAIARALAAEAPLLLMDEPFSALDPITRVRARQKFLELARQLNTTVVMVTHDVSEAVEVADQIALLENGALAQLGSPEELLLQPANAFVHHFFDGNRLELELRSLQLREILPLMRAVESPDVPEADRLEIAAKENLLEILERLAAGRKGFFSLPGAEIYSRAELFKGYFSWKDKLEKVQRGIHS